MRIDWHTYSVALRLVGHYRWAAYRPSGWSGGVYDHLLWVVTAGEGTLTTARGRFPLRRGRCAWFKPGVSFQVDQTCGRLAMYSIVFALKTARGHDLGFDQDLPDDALDEPQPGFAIAIARRLEALASDFGTSGHSAFAGSDRACGEHLLTGLLMELDRHNDHPETGVRPALTPAQAAVHRLARSIADDPACAPSAREQARIAGVSATHLCRLYRSLFRRSPTQFLVLFRIRHAKRLLLESELPLPEIAHRLGYRSIPFFSRQFKQQTGLSPTRFRLQGTVLR